LLVNYYLTLLVTNRWTKNIFKSFFYWVEEIECLLSNNLKKKLQIDGVHLST